MRGLRAKKKRGTRPRSGSRFVKTSGGRLAGGVACRGPVAVVLHKAVELLLVLGAAHLADESLELLTHGIELAPLLLDPLQLALAVFLEGDVAAVASPCPGSFAGAERRGPFG